MITIKSKNDFLIRLTDERVKHICGNHPEMKPCISWIIDTIENPDLLLSGDYGEILTVRKYDKTPVTNDKYLIAIYKETNDVDGFVLTAYFSRAFNGKRKVLWKH